MSSTEAAILSRVLGTSTERLDPQIAGLILALRFPDVDRDRMELLSEKARTGELDADEQAEIDDYERVGHLISSLKSMARRAAKP